MDRPPPNSQPSAWSSSDSYASDPSTSSAASGPSKLDGLSRTLGPQAASQLTEKEAEALQAIRKTATSYKRVGYVVGALATVFVARRRNPSLKPLPLFGYATFGSITGAMLMSPLALASSQKHIQNVEDPRHLMDVLRGSVEERRNRVPGKPSPVTSAGPASPHSDGRYSPQAQAPGRSNGASLEDSEVNNDGASFGVSSPTSASRWDQLRGENNSRPSKWDELRQQTARDALGKSHIQTSPYPDGRPSVASFGSEEGGQLAVSASSSLPSCRLALTN